MVEAACTKPLQCRKCGATVEVHTATGEMARMGGAAGGGFCLHPPITRCLELAAQIADAKLPG